MKKNILSWTTVLKNISDRAQDIDVRGAWPQANLRDLTLCGAMRWSVPIKFGGLGLPQLQLHRRYEQLASACLSTALIITQRDAALEFLICAKAGPSQELINSLLSKLASSHLFTSIGIAQLTTSGQHQKNGVRTAPDGISWRVSGIIPWSTAADHADFLIAGARTNNNDQLLFILDMKLPGVRILTAPSMAVLNATNTASVALNDVVITPEQVLSGPCPDALAIRNKYRRFSLNTCVLPLGVAAGALAMAEQLGKERSSRCQAAISSLRHQHEELARRVYAQGADKVEADSTSQPAMMRAKCNDLCFRCAAACLELAKGRGLMMEHPAQRRLREAMFFFVWSSGNGVIEETLRTLAGAR